MTEIDGDALKRMAGVRMSDYRYPAGELLPTAADPRNEDIAWIGWWVHAPEVVRSLYSRHPRLP